MAEYKPRPEPMSTDVPPPPPPPPPPKKPNDPWHGRSDGMRCRTCMWFMPKEKRVGRCRRHAPTLNGYPVVYDFDWCGDHKLNEYTCKDVG